MVRRRLDPDRATGQRRFTDRAFCYPGYQSADLAYAITGHSAQGATVHTGIALVTGTEDRQWLYPAMTRGTDTNLAFVFTTPARPADPQPGTRAAPELDRYDRTRPEHDGYPPGLAATADPGSLDLREPVAVLADVLGRDGAELSATQTRRRNLANADHLGILHAIWTAETTGARDDRYRALVLAALPPGHRQDLSPQARWLFRTLRAAELAGLDPAEVLRTAIASRDLAGARDIAAVLDARIRPRVYPLLPQPQGPWASRIPRLPDPARQAYLAEVAAMMDDRTQRLGQHAAQTGPAWAVAALGPVPADAAARRAWQTQGSLDRRLPRDVRLRPPRRPDRPRTQPPEHQTSGPPGTRPSPPSARPTAPTSGPCPTASCGCSATPTPPRPPGHPATSGRNCGWPGSAPSTPPWARSAPTPKPRPPARPATTTTPSGTTPWPPATGPCATSTSSENTPSPRPWPTGRNGSTPPPAPGTWPSPPTPNCAAATPARRSSRCAPPNQSPSPTPNATAGHPETATRIRDLAAQHHAFRQRTGQRQHPMTPRKDLDWAALGDTLPSWWAPHPDAILRPPKPEITPSAKILQLAAEQDIELEAGG